MTKEVLIGGKGITKKIIIGGNNPVSVQTMWKDGIVDVCENPSKLDSILKEINPTIMPITKADKIASINAVKNDIPKLWNA